MCFSDTFELRLWLKLRLHLIALMQQHHGGSRVCSTLITSRSESGARELQVKLKFPLLRETGRLLERVIAAIIAENIFVHMYRGTGVPGSGSQVHGMAGRPLCRQFDCPPLWHASRLAASRNGKQLMLQLLLLLTHCNCIVALCRPTHHCPLVWPLLSFLSSYGLCTAKNTVGQQWILKINSFVMKCISLGIFLLSVCQTVAAAMAYDGRWFRFKKDIRSSAQSVPHSFGFEFFGMRTK